MASALVPLANITLSSTASSVTFSSISGSYRDLMLVINGGAGGGGPYLQFNSDTGTNYNYVFLRGNGSTATSVQNGNDTYAQLNWLGISANGVLITHLLDYSTTNKHKLWLARTGTATTSTELASGRWASTSAISTIVAYPGVTWSAGTTFALYGVSA